MKLYRFEELLQNIKQLETDAAAAYFKQLLDDCGIPMPDDWRERVLIGSDKAQSGTARDNLTVDDSRIPKELGDQHKQLINYAVPGLRALLGYD